MSVVQFAPPYSADWIKRQAAERGATWMDHHDCGECGVMTGYVIEGESVWFTGQCSCTPYPHPYRRSSFEEIAAMLAKSPDPEKLISSLRRS